MEEDLKMLGNLLKEFKTYNDLDGIQDLKPYTKAIENLIEEYKTLKRDFEYIDHEHDRLDKRNNELIEENKKMKNQNKLSAKEHERVLNEIEEDYKKLKEQNEGLFELCHERFEKIAELLKENKELKEHIHFKVCENCKKEFQCKRSDTKYCKECASKTSSRWYKNLTDEQKTKRREQAKLNMRKLRAKKKRFIGG